MDKKKFHFYNRLTALIVFAIATAVYLLTIEPTASFWDCGEFIASSYRLEVGHPPGNPVFQLFARFFTIFTGSSHAAAAVNALSAICSALTILLLYLTIVFFARRLARTGENGMYTASQAICIYVSGAVGALACCFSDTFWFSAVEAEVYAMSSLFTALVFWLMTKWYEDADSPYANRWIVLICFLMGLSIGVHLLNLLSIPAIVFMYFYRMRENGRYSLKELAGIFVLSCILLAVLLFGLIPYLPKAAAYVDLFFVNSLGLPFNSGAAFFMVTLLGGCFFCMFRSLRKGKTLAVTALLCTTVIIIGFSVFSIVIIRSSVKTPTNEYQPDNPFTLVRYLNREQYGSKPLIYGEYFGAPYELTYDTYHTPYKGRYIKTRSMPEVSYKKEGKMLFPRMWDSREDSYIEFYKSYIGDKGIRVKGSDELKPTFMQNLIFFFDYQVNWMYWRYFMWNFAGRQNDIHSPVPGDPLLGNWESGIGFLDRFRLGDQRTAPAHLKDNKGKNHYYMLPLLLGIIGLFFQHSRDKRGCWLTFLMFFMTGLAIVVYLNQSPYQVRERDYAYAGSFYFFSLWIGLGVTAMHDWFGRKILHSVQDDKKGRQDDNRQRQDDNRERQRRIFPTLAGLLPFLGIPLLMGIENWDDHDRSNRYTAVEFARNTLESVGQNGILVTHGDNDTFPLWYAQEVENIRTDVRIVNTSLLGTDWHYDQMKYASNESAPLPLSVDLKQYLYGTNEAVPVIDTRDSAFLLSDIMRVFKHPEAKVELTNGERMDYIPSRKFIIPVNKANVLKHGILDEKYADMIPDHITLAIPSDKTYITKQELFFLDLLSNYKWDRPISLLSAGGDINIGIKDYLMYDGFSYRFVPVKNKTTRLSNDFTDPEDLYEKMIGTYSWDALKRTGWFVDYHNLYTFAGVQNQRKIFIDTARELLEAGERGKAVEILDMCQECVPESVIPFDLSAYGLSNEQYVLSLIEMYYMVGETSEAASLAARFTDQLLESADFFLMYYDWAASGLHNCCSILAHLAGLTERYGDTEISQKIEAWLFK